MGLEIGDGTGQIMKHIIPHSPDDALSFGTDGAIQI
jgi:hypothetical protein